jgi:transcriptional regulator with XRE-family HTH domain
MKDSPQQVAFYKQLGANIRKNRQRLELSQDDLARSIGLTRTSLTNIENGRQHPPLHTFCDLVEQLKVDASALLPSRATPIDALDVKAMAGQQVRGENELAFISSGISFKNEEKPHGDTKKKDRGNGRGTSS